MPVPIAVPGILTGMGTGMGLMNPLGDKVNEARGYALGYDTKQTPFDVAKERGLAGVAGGFVDNLTGGMTDLDKRGDSKKQKDAKNFLNAFIFGKGGRMTGDFNTPGTGMTA